MCPPVVTGHPGSIKHPEHGSAPLRDLKLSERAGEDALHANCTLHTVTYCGIHERGRIDYGNANSGCSALVAPQGRSAFSSQADSTPVQAHRLYYRLGQSIKNIFRCTCAAAAGQVVAGVSPVRSPLHWSGWVALRH